MDRKSKIILTENTKRKGSIDLSSNPSQLPSFQSLKQNQQQKVIQETKMKQQREERIQIKQQLQDEQDKMNRRMQLQNKSILAKESAISHYYLSERASINPHSLKFKLKNIEQSVDSLRIQNVNNSQLKHGQLNNSLQCESDQEQDNQLSFQNKNDPQENGDFTQNNGSYLNETPLLLLNSQSFISKDYEDRQSILQDLKNNFEKRRALSPQQTKRDVFQLDDYLKNNTQYKSLNKMIRRSSCDCLFCGKSKKIQSMKGHIPVFPPRQVVRAQIYKKWKEASKTLQRLYTYFIKNSKFKRSNPSRYTIIVNKPNNPQNEQGSQAPQLQLMPVFQQAKISAQKGINSSAHNNQANYFQQKLKESVFASEVQSKISSPECSKDSTPAFRRKSTRGGSYLKKNNFTEAQYQNKSVNKGEILVNENNDKHNLNLSSLYEKSLDESSSHFKKTFNKIGSNLLESITNTFMKTQKSSREDSQSKISPKAPSSPKFGNFSSRRETIGVIYSKYLSPLQKKKDFQLNKNQNKPYNLLSPILSTCSSKALTSQMQPQSQNPFFSMKHCESQINSPNINKLTPNYTSQRENPIMFPTTKTESIMYLPKITNNSDTNKLSYENQTPTITQLGTDNIQTPHKISFYQSASKNDNPHSFTNIDQFTLQLPIKQDTTSLNIISPILSFQNKNILTSSQLDLIEDTSRQEEEGQSTSLSNGAEFFNLKQKFDPSIHLAVPSIERDQRKQDSFLKKKKNQDSKSKERNIQYFSEQRPYLVQQKPSHSIDNIKLRSLKNQFCKQINHKKQKLEVGNVSQIYQFQKKNIINSLTNRNNCQNISTSNLHFSHSEKKLTELFETPSESKKMNSEKEKLVSPKRFKNHKIYFEDR